jgi:mannose-6-phosphate isomerase-like protein (cupin superfamily)
MDTDQRPWGGYQVLLKEPGFQVKRIEVKPKLRFSLQKHNQRSEKWIVTSGEGIATLDDRQVPVRRGSVIEVGLGQVHRMQNTGDLPLVLIEVQLGDYLGEDDIVRFEDDFSRK